MENMYESLVEILKGKVYKQYGVNSLFVFNEEYSDEKGLFFTNLTGEGTRGRDVVVNNVQWLKNLVQLTDGEVASIFKGKGKSELGEWFK